MAFFDFIKKKNKDVKTGEAIDISENKDNKNEETGAAETNDQDEKKSRKRRFAMMVEETFPAQNKDGIVTVGKVYGTIKNGDAAYLLEPDNRVTVVNVVGLAIENNKEMEPMEEASDRVVGVKVYDINGKSQISKYAVLTSIKPELDVKARTGIENPYVLGLSHGYRKLGRDREYMGIMLRELLKAHLLAPIYLEGQDNLSSEESLEELLAEKKISFPALSRQGMPEMADFALFTDWVELARWKNVFNENHPPKTMAIKLTDAVKMVTSQSSSHMSGIVINAFGENPIALSPEVLNEIGKADM